MSQEQLKCYENDWNEGVKTLERELKALHGDDFVMLDLKFQIKYPKERYDRMGNRVCSYDVRVIVASKDIGPFAVFQETESPYALRRMSPLIFVGWHQMPTRRLIQKVKATRASESSAGNNCTSCTGSSTTFVTIRLSRATRSCTR